MLGETELYCIYSQPVAGEREDVKVCRLMLNSNNIQSVSICLCISACYTLVYCLGYHLASVGEATQQEDCLFQT